MLAEVLINYTFCLEVIWLAEEYFTKLQSHNTFIYLINDTRIGLFP